MVDEHVRKDLDLAVPAVTPEVEEKILHSVGTDRAGRQKSTESILLLKLVTFAHPVIVDGFYQAKPTLNPGLSNQAKQKRLEFCLPSPVLNVGLVEECHLVRRNISGPRTSLRRPTSDFGETLRGRPHVHSPALERGT